MRETDFLNMLHEIWTTAQLAEFFDVTPRTIQLWSNPQNTNEKPLPKRRKDEYNFLEVVQWKIEQLANRIKELENEENDFELTGAKKEEQLMKNEKTRLALRREFGDVVEVQPVLVAWVAEVRVFINMLETLKFELIRDLGVDDETKQLIENKFHDAREITSSQQIEIEDDVEKLIEKYETGE